MHGTQDTLGWYRQRTKGITDFTRPDGLGGFAKRRVMTTRRDGTMRFQVGTGGGYLVTGERDTGDHYSDTIQFDLAAMFHPGLDAPPATRAVPGILDPNWMEYVLRKSVG